MFVNDIIYEVNNLNLGINIGHKKLRLLLYAEALVLLSDTEELQIMVNISFVHRVCGT